VVDVRETVAHCLGGEGTAAETLSSGRGEELAGMNHR